MEQLKKAIQQAISASGIQKAIQQESAVSIWGDVVGVGISKVTEAISVNKGTLVVKTGSATWRQELFMQKKEIIDKINSFFGYAAVEKLKFISFDDAQTKFKKIYENENHVTNSKYTDRINDIKNDKIKKSLLELTKLFKQR